MKMETDSEGRGVALPLTTSELLLEARENTVPAYVTTDIPGEAIWLPIAKPVRPTMNVWPATARVATRDSGRGDSMPITSSALLLGAKAIFLPSTVAAFPPALITLPLMSVMTGSAKGAIREWY